jgi:parallel beta-helix repeat protein
MPITSPLRAVTSLIVAAAALSGAAAAFEPLSGPAWPGKAMIVRTTCANPQPLLDGARRVVLEQMPSGLFTLTAFTGVTPQALRTNVALERTFEGYRLRAGDGRVLTVDVAGPSYTTDRGQCSQVFRFDQYPMTAPARAVLLVGAAHPSYPGARRFDGFDAAIQAARPGDLILLDAGRHKGPFRVPAERSGRPGAWITIASLEPHKAELVGHTEQAILEIGGARYIEVRGLRVRNDGIGDCLAARGSAYVRFIGNITADCMGGGIAAMQSDHVRIEGNISARNAFTSPWQNSGISLYQAQAIDNAPGWHIVIVNNVSALNDNWAPPPGQKYATDGNGIIVDDGRNTQLGSTAGAFPHATLVENNLVFGNGGSGIRAFESDRVTFRRNTTFSNATTNSPRIDSGSEMALLRCGECRFEANVAVSAGEAAAVQVYGDAKDAAFLGNVLSTRGDPRGLIRIVDAAPMPDFSKSFSTLPVKFRAPMLSLAADFTVLTPPGAGADLRLLPPLEIAR